MSVCTRPSAGLLESRSPVDGSLLGVYAPASAVEVHMAAAALRDAAAPWAAVPLRERLCHVRRLRATLAERADLLARLLAREIGRPLVEGYGGEILTTLSALRWLESHAEEVLRPRALDGVLHRRRVERVPFGVVGVITPWNYPLFLTTTTVAWALAAGNTVLWKPSELALGCAEALEDAFSAAGLSEVVRAVPGDAHTGAAVVDANCDKYVFIGGTRAGRQVLSRLGERLRPAVAELSGVDAMLVLADADLETAARSAVWARVAAAGQTCMAPKRIFVAEPIYLRFEELVSRCLRRLRAGDPTDWETEVGPLRTPALLRDAIGAIEDAVRSGARLVQGGDVLPGPGCHLQPALLSGCGETMRVFQEDLFAPVLAMMPFETPADAVRAANRGPSMLTASVWTRDRRRGAALARELAAGVVSVNDLMLPAARGEAPFGGAGESGWGRLRGAEGLLEMVQPRVVDEGPPAWAPRLHLPPYREGTRRGLRVLAAWEGKARPGRWGRLAPGALERLRKGATRDE